MRTSNLKANIYIVPFQFVKNGYFKFLQGSVATLFTWSWKILLYFVANLPKTLHINFYQNQSSIVEVMIKKLWCVFYATQCRSSSATIGFPDWLIDGHSELNKKEHQNCCRQYIDSLAHARTGRSIKSKLPVFVTLSYIGQFSKFLHWCTQLYIYNTVINKYPPHLKFFAALPCKFR